MLACEESLYPYRLKLVYSKDDDEDIKDIPEGLIHTYVEHFASSDDLNGCILSNEDFIKSLRKLTAQEGMDTLTDLGTMILGIWDSSNKKGITLKYIKEKLQQQSASVIRLKGVPPKHVKRECKDILSRLGIAYKMTGDVMNWSHISSNGHEMSGREKWTEELEARLIQVNPTLFLQFIQIINS